MKIDIVGMCDGLGHWNVSVTDGTGVVASLPTEWDHLQVPLDPAEWEQLALLVLRAKCAGQPLNTMGDLLLNGVTI